MNLPDLPALNTDDDTQGITVTPVSGLTTTEAGGTATFTIKLNSEPTATVSIGISSSNTAEGTVSPSTVSFDSGNWNTAQTVTVTGVNDDVDDNNQAYTIVTAAATGGDYAGFNPPDVSVTNNDDDIAGVTISPTSGLTTTKAEGTAGFKVKWNSKQTANVTINITSGDPTEGSVSVSSLTFTAGNWNSTQNVNITGVDDQMVDGSQAYTVNTVMSTGADLLYNGINPSDVSVTNSDDDVAGFTVTPTSGLTVTEATGGGNTTTFTIKLTSQPTADVTIGLSSNDTSEGTVSPSSLTFTGLNWNTNQTVSITGIDDFVKDGNILFTIVTAAATSGDSNYNLLNPADVTVSNIDNDVAGINVSPTSGLVTAEDGTTANFSIVLNSQPTATVTIGISSSDATEGSVSTTSVVFNASNWNVSQPITITGLPDNMIDGSISYTIVTAAASSSDSNYNSINPSDVSVSNTNIDVAGITVSPTAGLTTAENGNQATFTIVMNTIPTANVTVTLSSNNTNEGTVSPTSVSFLPGTWNVSQTVTITGVDDLVDDGDIAYSIITSNATSGDGNYNGFIVSDVSVTNLDNDVAGITVTPTSGLVTSENLTTATFTVVLDTKPTANVKIDLSSDNTNEGTVSPNALTFKPTDWNTPQTVTVSGKNDNLNDGDIAYNIITAPATSSDSKYSGLDAADVSVTNNDNDTPGIVVSPTDFLTTSEAGGTATFTVVLITQPTANVVIDLTSSDTGEGTVSPATLTFTNSNWNTAQTVTVTGVNDALEDGDESFSIVTGSTSADNDYETIDPDDVSVTNTDFTPTITLGTNPTVCKGSTSANLGYSATTKSPNQYSIDYNAAANTAGFVDVTNASLPATPIVLTVPAGAAAGVYNANLTVRNSTYGICVSAVYPITITLNDVTSGTVGTDQTICSGGDPAAFTQSSASTGSGTLSYRWESSTVNCSSGFNPIGGATAITYDVPSRLTQTTYYRRVTISTLNGVTCEANGACNTVTVLPGFTAGQLSKNSQPIF